MLPKIYNHPLHCNELGGQYSSSLAVSGLWHPAYAKMWKLWCIGQVIVQGLILHYVKNIKEDKPKYNFILKMTRYNYKYIQI